MTRQQEQAQIDTNTDTYHHLADHTPDEDIFKCRQCGEKYGHCMASSDDVSLCRWCSGEEE